MCLTVVRAHLIGYIINRCRNQVEVGDNHRSGKYYVEVNRTTGEGEVGGSCHYIYTLLCGGDDVGTRLKDILKKSEIYISTTCCVMAMGSKYVFSHYQLPFLFFSQLVCLSLNPRLACTDDLCTIDIKFEDVIVRELYPQVFLKIFGRERHSATHIDVTVSVSP